LTVATTLVALQMVSAGEIAPADRRSDYSLMSRDNQAMQDDDRANPGMLWVLEGEKLWTEKVGSSAQSCADCHGRADDTMKGVAARYPTFDPARGRLVDLEQRINLCRTDHQHAAPLAWEDHGLLGLTAYVASQSRGLPTNVTVDDSTRPHLAAGRTLFTQRQGQINLSCEQCHDDHWGERLGGNIIPQGHPNGFPIYRLEWQSLGSLQRRLRNCMTAVRAEPYPYGSSENVDLEFYLMWRARGLPIEAPAVRP